MAQYTMQAKHASLIAIDQHARSVTMRGLDLATGEEKGKRLADCPTASEIVSWAMSWATPPIRFAYESGPCGFQLAREIRALGHDCDIIAVSSIARSNEDKYLKDDKRDAERLLAELSSVHSKCKSIWIPSEEYEADRDLVRTYSDSVAAAKRAKLQMSSFLLRRGHVWNERTKSGNLKKTWSVPYINWARHISFKAPSDTVTHERYLRFALENISRMREMEKLCLDLARSEQYKPYIDALCRLKGVDDITAITVTVTIGDFSRFKNGRSVSAYFGLTPKRHDSGEKRGRNGHVTKAGDTTCRHAVVEALAGISNFTRAAKVITKGKDAASSRVEAEAKKCNLRNIDRYQHLISHGKPANVAKVAVASELVCDMWIIGRMVQEEVIER
jgi:transposase